MRQRRSLCVEMNDICQDLGIWRSLYINVRKMQIDYFHIGSISINLNPAQVSLQSNVSSPIFPT